MAHLTGLQRQRRSSHAPGWWTTFFFLCLWALPGPAWAQTDPVSEIIQASQAGDSARVAVLLTSHPDLLGARDGDGMTPLLHAAKEGHTGLAGFLLEQGADIRERDAMNRTPLHHAANEGKAGTVALLLSRGAPLEERDGNGRTPLFLAVNWGNDPHVVDQLIRAGANVNDVTPRGEQVLFSTLFYGLPEIIDALLDAGARLPEDDGRLLRAAYLAASNGFEGIFRMATEEAGARDLPWWEAVPMHAAARGGAVPIGEALLEKGAAVDEKNLYGITPLHMAAEEGRLAFTEFLAERGASLDERSRMGMTAYHYALERGHDSVVGRLLALGASAAPPVFPELRGPWLGQPEVGRTPERFALGIVSGHDFNSEHSPAVFSPDGTEVYWTRAFRGPISYSRMEDGRWTAPTPALFVSEFGEGEPVFSPDGNRLYFMSMRPLQPGAEAGKENIWFLEKEGEGWAGPRPVGPAVNDLNLHWCFSLAETGTLYFHTVREGGMGQQDLYRSRQVDGVFQTPENLGPAINTEGLDMTPFIAPDESYLIYASSGHGLQEGMLHFVISYREADGGWSPPQPLDDVTRPVADALCPMITPDEEFMFFIGSGDIWWVRADFIRELGGR